MRTRRGTDFWPGGLGNMISQYQPGDIVTSVAVGEDGFIGSVREVHPKLNKVVVAWGGGASSQHDPDEIMLHPHMNDFLVRRMTAADAGITRRVRSASDLQKINEKVEE